MKKIPLHWQIIIALIIGAVFGAVFPVSQTAVVIEYGDSSVRVEHWRLARVITGPEGARDTLNVGQDKQLVLVGAFSNMKRKQRLAAVLEVQMPEGAVRQFSNIKVVRKPETVATYVRPLGTLFLNLLKMIAIPLVLGTLIVGAASLGDLRKVARIGGKSIGFYLVTTAIAISIGLLVANVVQPGKSIPAETKERLLSEFQEGAAAKLETEMELSPLDFVLSLVPTNPFEALAGGSMLHIVFFAVFFGLVLSFVQREKAEPVLKFFDGLGDVMIKMVEAVMIIAPIGVFALMSATIADFGIGILSSLGWYTFSVVLGLLLHSVFSYGSMVTLLSRVKLLTFVRRMFPAQLVAFSTSSSAATLPVTMECADEMKVPKTFSSFVLPLGATINMDGTALYQGVAAVFIAQVYGLDLSIAAQLGIVLTATLASIGTAPVPGVGLVMLIVVLRQAGVPEEGIALILGVDRILDMLRTAVNITGDAAVTAVVASSEGWNGKD